MDPLEIVVGVLEEAFSDGMVPVSTEVPFERPDRLVVASLDGGTADAFVMRPYVGITCWGTSGEDALGMATHAADALRNASLDHPLLTAAQVESMSRTEWAANGQARYHVRMRLTINTDD